MRNDKLINDIMKYIEMTNEIMKMTNGEMVNEIRRNDKWRNGK